MIKFLILFIFIKLIDGHGRMIDPPGRGSMWRFGFDDALPNYNDMVTLFYRIMINKIFFMKYLN